MAKRAYILAVMALWSPLDCLLAFLAGVYVFLACERLEVA